MHVEGEGISFRARTMCFSCRKMQLRAHWVQSPVELTQFGAIVGEMEHACWKHALRVRHCRFLTVVLLPAGARVRYYDTARNERQLVVAQFARFMVVIMIVMMLVILHG
jgi:hypothetical protein